MNLFKILKSIVATEYFLSVDQVQLVTNKPTYRVEILVNGVWVNDFIILGEKIIVSVGQTRIFNDPVKAYKLYEKMQAFKYYTKRELV